MKWLSVCCIIVITNKVVLYRDVEKGGRRGRPPPTISVNGAITVTNNEFASF